MKRKLTNSNRGKSFALFFVVLIIAGCKSHWTVSDQMGSVPEVDFLETVPFDFDSKFIIIPVTIKGKTYRFLYDTGAPFGISKPIQKELGFKQLKKSRMKDSDNNRSQISWVKVDTVLIGGVPFCNQSAFVGDFRANPVLACFKVDGIIGSNNIRLCNWYIDYENEQLHLTNQKADTFGIKGFDAPFEFNRQYTITLDLKSGPVILKDMHLDTGSNGDLSIYPSQFDTLVKYKQTKKIYELKGVKQSGILGEVTPVSSRHTELDSLVIGNLVIPNVGIGTSSSKLIGNEILSLYDMIIDSDSQKLIFKKNGIEPVPYASFGFTPGSTDGKNVFVQAVYSGTPSALAGILPDMEILSFDSLEFKTDHNICDFVEHAHKTENLTATMKVKAENGDTLIFILEKKKFYE